MTVRVSQSERKMHALTRRATAHVTTWPTLKRSNLPISRERCFRKATRTMTARVSQSEKKMH